MRPTSPGSVNVQSALEVWGILEGRATNLTVPLLEQSDLDEARRVNHALAACAPGDAETWRRRALEFHDVLYRRCPNARLLGLTREHSRMLRTDFAAEELYSPELARDSIWEHDLLLDLLTSRLSGNDTLASPFVTLGRSHPRRLVEVCGDLARAADNLHAVSAVGF